MNLYRYENKRTGKVIVETYEYWQQWAKDYYRDIAYYELVPGAKQSDALMPKDWWDRLQRVLKLETIVTGKA